MTNFIQVFVTKLSGEELEFVARLEDTVQVLKDQLALPSGIPAARQSLSLKAGIAVLSDDKRVSELVVGGLKLELSLTAVQCSAVFLAMVPECPGRGQDNDDGTIKMDLHLAELNTNTLEWFAGLWDAARAPECTLDDEMYVKEGKQYLSRTLGKVGEIWEHRLSDLVQVEGDRTGIPSTNPTTMSELVSVLNSNMYPEGTIDLSDGRVDWTNTGDYDHAYEFVDVGSSVSSRFQDHVIVGEYGAISLKHVSFNGSGYIN
ncbi:unnamed protein product [Polarella glacialis]|uniref:Ubiquitin-like domain-containing protein n=1 Tax=Polarella glacialis TaxID=89957 RepID=A0A813HFA0_POLGL|nr:unnamed protein product [Polarella glacialis]